MTLLEIAGLSLVAGFIIFAIALVTDIIMTSMEK
jgi:hypothetical protein